MFNRSVEVKLVKSPKDKAVSPVAEEVESIDYTKAVQDTVRIVAANVVAGVVIYVGLDTVRQVLVKLTPGH